MLALVDLSAALRPAVYVLYRRGRVVWVGAARKPLLRLYAHVNQRRGEPAAPFLPARPLDFDAIDLIPCRVDELEARHAEVSSHLAWRDPRTPTVVPLTRRTANV